MCLHVFASIYLCLLVYKTVNTVYVFSIPVYTCAYGCISEYTCVCQFNCVYKMYIPMCTLFMPMYSVYTSVYMFIRVFFLVYSGVFTWMGVYTRVYLCIIV